jgi:hypothetical protein
MIYDTLCYYVSRANFEKEICILLKYKKAVIKMGEKRDVLQYVEF